jgi:alanine racemase
MKWAEVDLGALRHNAAAFRREMGEGVQVMAMVKAGAYGHGGPRAAEALLDGGATWLGVALPGEALELRQAGVEAPILVVGWSHPDTHPAMVDAGVDITISDPAGVDAVGAAVRDHSRPARVQVKVETGMYRQGVDAASLPAVLARIAEADPRLQLTGVFTHLADADGADPTHAEQQHRRFVQAVEVARRFAPDALVHAANSAAALRFPHMRHDMVRPGIALTVQALVTHVHTVPTGEWVGYGCTWRAPRDTLVATIAAGYADGVHRAQSNRGSAVLHGARCPILGRVSMDQVTVDITAVPQTKPGDVATLVGPELPADEVAAIEDTISYEVLCAISGRVPRRFVAA